MKGTEGARDQWPGQDTMRAIEDWAEELDMTAEWKGDERLSVVRRMREYLRLTREMWT